MNSRLGHLRFLLGLYVRGRMDVVVVVVVVMVLWMVRRWRVRRLLNLMRGGVLVIFVLLVLPDPSLGAFRQL